MSDGGSRPTVAVVVVNWNGRALLDDCFASLRDSYPGLRVLMVDNGSTDDSADYVRAQHSWVEVLSSRENLRWAGGNNLGLDHLRREGLPDYVLLLNNDTIVKPGCVSGLVDALEADAGAWAATPRICYAHDPELIWYDGGVVGAWSGWVSHRHIRRRVDAVDRPPARCDYGTGCALMLSRRCLEQIGNLDTSYHLYAEDTDYSLRLRARGGVILHRPDAVVLHKVSASVGAGSPAKAYLKARSHVLLLRRHWRRRTWPVLWPAQVVHVLAAAGWHLLQGRPPTALASIRGVVDELLHRPHETPSSDSA